jgi:hypothetical protein
MERTRREAWTVEGGRRVSLMSWGKEREPRARRIEAVSCEKGEKRISKGRKDGGFGCWAHFDGS